MGGNIFLHICCLVVALVVVVQSHVDIEGSQVWRLTPTTESELEFIYKFAHLNSDHIDVWQHSSVLHRPIDVMVPAGKLDMFRNELQPHLSKFDVMIEDVHGMVSEQEEELNRRRQLRGLLRTFADFDYTIYHTHDEIQAWMDMAADEFSEVEQFQVGVSYEGRKINALKISMDPSSVNKTTLYVDSLIHAREWITAASVMWTFKEILTNPDLAYMKDAVDWYIVPMVNIDGYAYTQTERLWRKTRSKGMNVQSGSGCQGVDGNRNWNYQWGGVGASPYPCDITYHGPLPFSESETRHLSYFIEANKDIIKAVISVHSYGQLLLYPYCYELNQYPTNRDELDTLGQNMQDAMFALYGKTYVYGQCAETIYIHGGTTIDWGAGVASIGIDFTIELRDEGEYGFLLPPEQILPTAGEFLEAMKVLVAHVDT